MRLIFNFAQPNATRNTNDECYFLWTFAVLAGRYRDTRMAEAVELYRGVLSHIVRNTRARYGGRFFRYGMTNVSRHRGTAARNLFVMPG